MKNEEMKEVKTSEECADFCCRFLATNGPATENAYLGMLGYSLGLERDRALRQISNNFRSAGFSTIDPVADFPTPQDAVHTLFFSNKENNVVIAVAFREINGNQTGRVWNPDGQEVTLKVTSSGPAKSVQLIAGTTDDGTSTDPLVRWIYGK